MSFNEKLSAAEAILFSYGEPMEAKKLAEITETDVKTVENFVNILNDRYEDSGSAFQIVKLDKSYQMCTRKEYAAYVKKALDTNNNVPVSQAAMETLALIAYNQPVTKSFVESVRGTDSSSVVNKLAERGLICEAGRLEIPGRPIAYKTTELFLKCFGLSSVDELPPLEEKPVMNVQEGEE
ncbi:MAG: SMC-Scp complex subunit ScpB [Oscillospiraceae bacterium]